MIKTVKQACRFNPIIRDYRMSQAIENLAELIGDQGDGRAFFARNYITHGMETRDMPVQQKRCARGNMPHPAAETTI